MEKSTLLNGSNNKSFLKATKKTCLFCRNKSHTAGMVVIKANRIVTEIFFGVCIKCMKKNTTDIKSNAREIYKFTNKKDIKKFFNVRIVD